MTPKLKVGLIVDSEIASKQIDQLVKLSLNSNLYEISYLIIQETKQNSGNIVSKVFRKIGKNGFNGIVRSATFKIIIKIESLFVKNHKDIFKDFFDKFDLKLYGIKSIVVKPNVSPSGLVYIYTEEDLKKIEYLNIDLLIRGGSGILRGKILDVCHKGIISFHHADNDVNRGGPPGFWEVFDKQKRTGFTIQLLNNELDGGEVIFKGFVATSFLYTLNYVNLISKSTVFLHKAIESLLDGNSHSLNYPSKPYSYPLYMTPRLLHQLRYVISTFIILIGRVYQ